MDFKQAVTSVLSKYVTIQGRSPRSEYWFWVLFVVICSAILNVVDSTIFGVDPMTQRTNGVFGTIFTLATLLPGICVGVRRMHDLDKSGWWILINLIPIVGWIVFIVWAATKGTAGPNRFGLDPLTSPNA